RIVRVVAGLALIGGGLALVFSATNVVLGVVLAVVGLVPLLAGALDFCVFAPLFGAPLSGIKVRALGTH
ncbi:MAG: YgaP-like transmembrane domain, partial [Ktedonobacterales bacterium]